MFALTAFGDVLVAVAAYVASIYTWPWLRTKLIGTETEIRNLETRIAAIKAALKI